MCRRNPDNTPCFRTIVTMEHKAVTVKIFLTIFRLRSMIRMRGVRTSIIVLIRFSLKRRHQGPIVSSPYRPPHENWLVWNNFGAIELDFVSCSLRLLIMTVSHSIKLHMYTACVNLIRALPAADNVFLDEIKIQLLWNIALDTFTNINSWNI